MAAEYGSDVIVDLMKAYEIEYAALNPGSSFRGLHDSLVNYGGNKNPEVILCCHEEVAVSMAYGYARVTGKPMVAIVHDLVGLQHASMAIYNAWTSRTPIIVMGGTGPMDTSKRRSGIDWTHTALVQGNLVRDYAKWDDQPASVRAIPESFIRAYNLSCTDPKGPVYLCYDVTVQEEKLDEPISLPEPGRYPLHLPMQAPEEGFEKTISWLGKSRRPVIIAESSGRTEPAFNALIELSELLMIPVLDRGGRLNFPMLHSLNLTGQEKKALSRADLVLAFDVADLSGATRSAPPEAKIIHVRLNDLLVRSWSQDYDEPPKVDLSVFAATEIFLPELVRRIKEAKGLRERFKASAGERGSEIQKLSSELEQALNEEKEKKWEETPISSVRLCAELAELLNREDFVLTNGSSNHKERHFLDCRKFNQSLGKRRFGGVGNGLPGSLGAALALKRSNKLCVGIQPDGDFLFNPSALWTAAHYEIPLLMIVFNNRSYYNDEEHQAVMARRRGRPVENKTIGIRLDKPAVNFARLAETYEVRGFGPVTQPSALRQALREGADYVKEKRLPAVVDVVMQNR
ncbi:MAG: thiamine pyrophosphate-binding protein [Deltaproteobacteria bacterium]|nr:thiamine pyrophosphate-binding protein [Deltaproteobacteria bacterium]